MRHQVIEKHLSDYVTGRLPKVRAWRLKTHIERCEECREWSETFRLVRAALAVRQVEDQGEHLSSESLARRAVVPESLTAEARATQNRHLARCVDCSHELEMTSLAVRQGRTTTPATERAVAVEDAWKRILFPTPPKLAIAAAMVLAVVGVFFVMHSRQAVSPTREISGVTYVGEHVVHAAKALSAAEVRVEDGAKVTFTAGEAVVLGDGFSVGKRATFAVEIVQRPMPGDS